MKTHRISSLGACFTVVVLMGNSLSADQLEDDAMALPNATASENASLAEAKPSQLPIDCGDQRTIVSRVAEAEEPLRLDASSASEEDWAAYERKVLERFNSEPSPEVAEDAEEPLLEHVEGCALDQWEADPSNLSVVDNREVEVSHTGMDADRTIAADKPKDNQQSGVGGAQEAAHSRPSAKSTEDNVPIEKLLDMLVGQVVLAVGFVTALLFVLRYLARIVLGYFFRRRTCRIGAELFTNNFSFSGQILVLGKKGCRFVPEDYASLDKVLDIPEFLKFSVSAGGVTKSVWVNRTHGTAVAAFFNSNLLRAEQDKMLQTSTIEVKFDRWRPAKTSRKKGIKSVNERIAKLNELREEELARKAANH